MKKDEVILQIPELSKLREDVAKLTERVNSLIQEMKSDRTKDKCFSALSQPSGNEALYRPQQKHDHQVFPDIESRHKKTL